MNNIGIEHNLDRKRIKKLLSIGLFASILTGIGDFILGYADSTVGNTLATSVMAGAANLSDWQMIAGGLLGFVGIFLEGLACFAIYRLMADAAPKYAHLYRAGIFGYIWLAPIGCHMNMGILNLAYKYLLLADETLAENAADLLFYGFSQPIYLLLIFFWLPMMIIQFKAFAEGLTPYPKKARWFCVLIGAIPALILSAIIGMRTALGSAIGTMFLSFGNVWMFGGLLSTLPEQERFEEFERTFFKKKEA
ncbi:MAG: hypothetical protein K6A70_07875 [Erysipelotrichaceae bacterium]|nr:hypothetical protein [Erysipelotrichaceae bacterium]